MIQIAGGVENQQLLCMGRNATTLNFLNTAFTS